jgi:hypothetical protein
MFSQNGNKKMGRHLGFAELALDSTLDSVTCMMEPVAPGLGKSLKIYMIAGIARFTPLNSSQKTSRPNEMFTP